MKRGREFVTLALATAFSLALPIGAAAQSDTRPDRAVFLSNAPGLQTSLRPIARPGPVLKVSRAGNTAVTEAKFAPGRSSIRPMTRPSGIGRTKPVLAVSTGATRPISPVTRGNEKRICGSRSIMGYKLSPIPGKLYGCGVAQPVQVTSVDGVWLTQPATMECSTAKALNSWIKDGVKPAVRRLGGGVASLSVIAHYSCRTRNSQPGAKISEHGKGRAIDVAAINLKNGQSLTVLHDWRKKTTGKVMRVLHATACGPFRTVLGPNADKYHQDHFHLDTSRRGGKSYCR
ncbi:MAG: extensin family protein [Marinosulfonomonas sp.]|nr:extensin family protein [Marinosulfonomonas sp.]